MTRVVVVGGGITGLAAAWELLRSGAEVAVLEATDRLGGKILTDEIGGRPVDLGPDAFVARTPEDLRLFRELGLEGELVRAATDEASVWVRGKLRPLPRDVVLGVPSRLASVARSGILSPSGVARAAVGPLLPRASVEGDRSVGDLVVSRLGPQVHDRLVDPLFGGIHAGPAKRLSLQATAPQLAVAAGHRSLVRGVRSQRKGDAAPRPSFHSLAGGLGRLVDRLEEELRAGGAAIELESPVESLPVGDADGMVVTTPALVTAGLVAGASPEAGADLGAIGYASVTVTVLAYPAGAFPKPLSGSGFLVPHSEGRLITACSFASSKWPHWAGPGEVVLRASAGRAGDVRALELSDVELVQRVHAELVDALGVAAAPVRARVTRWLDAFPQYRVGHLERVQRIQAALGRDLPGVVVAGAAYRGLGITTCISEGRSAARRALEWAESRPPAVRPPVAEPEPEAEPEPKAEPEEEEMAGPDEAVAEPEPEPEPEGEEVAGPEEPEPADADAAAAPVDGAAPHTAEPSTSWPVLPTVAAGAADEEREGEDQAGS